MAIDDKLIDQLLEDYEKPEDLMGQNGVLKNLTKKLIERAMEGEITHKLGYEKYDKKAGKAGNSRNGTTPKTIKGDFGEVVLDVPRDRNSEYSPQIIKKNQSRFDGFDDKIIALYSKGMSTRDITSQLQDMYGVEVSAELISNVTSKVMDEVKEWQVRPLDSVYPIVYLDALVLKIRDQGHVVNKHIYVAIGINIDGFKDVLGLWIEQNEGAKFWLKILTELKQRGLEDIFIVCVDGLKGFPEAIESVFEKSQVQLCIVHMIRNSLKYVPWNQRKEVAADLRTVYTSATDEKAFEQLEAFGEKWNSKYPLIERSWKSNWQRVIPFFSFPDEVRKIIYTTNAIESLNYTLKKSVKNKGSFPNEEAALKMLYLSLRQTMKKWTMPVRSWGMAINQFSIMFEGRL